MEESYSLPPLTRNGNVIRLILDVAISDFNTQSSRYELPVAHLELTGTIEGPKLPTQVLHNGDYYETAGLRNSDFILLLQAEIGFVVEMLFTSLGLKDTAWRYKVLVTDDFAKMFKVDIYVGHRLHFTQDGAVDRIVYPERYKGRT